MALKNRKYSPLIFFKRMTSDARAPESRPGKTPLRGIPEQLMPNHRPSAEPARPLNPSPPVNPPPPSRRSSKRGTIESRRPEGPHSPRRHKLLTQTSFGRSVDLLQRSMAASTLRRQLIANNLANAETPNFKRSSLSFEAELGRALASEQQPASIGVTTHENHIPFDRVTDYRSVNPRVSLDYLTTAKNNGNNVDVEHEVMQAAENQMMYELMTGVVSHQFRQVNIVLR